MQRSTAEESKQDDGAGSHDSQTVGPGNGIKLGEAGHTKRAGDGGQDGGGTVSPIIGGPRGPGTDVGHQAVNVKTH